MQSVVLLSVLAAGASATSLNPGVLASDRESASLVYFQNRPQEPAGEALADQAADRPTEVVTRTDSRAAVDPMKVALLSQATGVAITRSEDMSDEDPRTIARALLTEFGFAAGQFDCLDALWQSESGWRWNADNPRSSAYGIPQALPGSKMASAGADWATNPVTQIRWGLGYIEDRYGTPCQAWSIKRVRGWY